MGRKGYVRSDVVAAAMEQFWAKGFRGTSVQDLCDATGLNRKSLYAEFKDKSDLLAEAVRVYTHRAIMQSEEALRAEPLGTDNIRRYFGGMRFESDCRGCLMTMTINERALVPVEAVEIVQATLDHIEAMLRANLEAAGIDGAGAERIATFLVFSIQGITTMGKLTSDPSKLARAVESILEVVDRAAAHV